MILPKCRVFCQNTVTLCFHKNILFLISIIWSLLCQFNTKYLHFLWLCYKSLCALLQADRDVIVVCISPRIYIFLDLETMNLSKLAAIWTAVILPWFLWFSQKCAMCLPFFCRDFPLSPFIAMTTIRVLVLYTIKWSWPCCTCHTSTALNTCTGRGQVSLHQDFSLKPNCSLSRLNSKTLVLDLKFIITTKNN